MAVTHDDLERRQDVALLPCPFCAGEAKLRGAKYMTIKFPMCTSCGAEHNSPEKWNLRASERDAFKEALREYLEANDAYAKAQLTANTARDNYSDANPELSRLAKAIGRVSQAEQRVRSLLSDGYIAGERSKEGKT